MNTGMEVAKEHMQGMQMQMEMMEPAMFQHENGSFVSVMKISMNHTLPSGDMKTDMLTVQYMRTPTK